MTTDSRAADEDADNSEGASEEHAFEMRGTAKGNALQRNDRQNPITMATLFYIVTLGAILSASLRPLVGNDQVTSGSLGIAFSLAAIVGILSGMGLGCFYFRRPLAIGLGLIAGILAGLMAGALSLVDSQHFVEISALTFGGCWVLVLCMAFSARFSKEH